MDISKIYIFDRDELIRAFNSASGSRSKTPDPEPTIEQDRLSEEEYLNYLIDREPLHSINIFAIGLYFCHHILEAVDYAVAIYGIIAD
jgi:hypothetical protein